MLKTPIRSKPKADVAAVGGGSPTLVPPEVVELIDRAEKAAAPYIPIWEEALAFFDNRTYVERSAISGELISLETREGNSNAKPRWRSRLTRNRYTPGMERVRSRMASRVPPPRCSAPSHNAEARSAASLSEKALQSAHRKLRGKQLTLDTLVYTLNCGAGYVWPFWDANVGPFIRDTRPLTELAAAAGGTMPGLPGGPALAPEPQAPTGTPALPAAPAAPPVDAQVGQPGQMPGETIGPAPGPNQAAAAAALPAPPVEVPEKWLREGEIGNWILHPRDVGYQPGVPFEDSRYYYVRRALPVDQVLAQEGYTGPEQLAPDAIATTNYDARNTAPDANLVYVYHFLERPSKKYRQGRWIEFANGAKIHKDRDYPCDRDVPVIHALEDIRRPHRDRPMGRGELAVDVQRTYHRTINQIIAWKNLVLNPQMLAPKGSIRTPRTEQPGLVIEYRPMGGQAPQWMPVPEIPVGLFKTLDQCLADFEEILGDGDLNVASLESGSQVAQVRADRDESRRATLAENLAVFYQGLYGHWLYLIQKHYTEPRLLEVKTRFGIESIPEFLGSTLMPGITVFIDPGDVQPRTREAQQAMLMTFADRGWIPPHQAIAAIRSGDADSLIDEFELDIARAHREVQQLIAMGRGEGNGPVFAGPMDNHEVHQWVIGNWMKTEDFERQPDIVRQAALYHYQQHEAEIAWQAMQQAGQQQMAAAQRGLSGAAGQKAGGSGPSGGGVPSPSPGGGQAPIVSQPSAESNARALMGAPSPS